MEISIIVPTYRPKEYLWQCLDAIDKQTLEHDCFEVLLVLNGERSPYEEQILAYLSAHPSLPCRLIYNDERGVSAARNRGLDEAKGKYICFIDDDDIISTTYLKQLREYATEDIVPLSHFTAFDDETGMPQPFYVTQDYRENCEKMPYTRARRFFYICYCKIIHRDIIGTRRFDTSLANGEDALFMFLISDRLKWIRFTDKAAEYRYRLRSTSAFNAPRPASYHISNMLQCQAKASRIFWTHPLRYSFIFYVKYLLATIMGCIRQIRKGQKDKGKGGKVKD